MANKTLHSALPQPVPPTPHETDSDDLDERFREAIQRGDTNGDVVFLDEQGNEIKDAPSNKTIFDF